jgi:methanogenic corrinoid protein MtbC1
MKHLEEDILAGRSADAERQARMLLDQGVSVRDILVQGIEGAMDTLSEKCAMEQYNLLEIMLAGRAVMAVMRLICEQESFAQEASRGTVVVASLRGDVHDLGKNIVKMALVARGYKVMDCGKDCAVDRLVATALEERALAIGISGLISTIVPQVRQVRDALDEEVSIPIVAGGAALKQLSAEQLQVDYVAQTVFDGVEYIERLSGVRGRA